MGFWGQLVNYFEKGYYVVKNDNTKIQIASKSEHFQ